MKPTRREPEALIELSQTPERPRPDLAQVRADAAALGFAEPEIVDEAGQGNLIPPAPKEPERRSMKPAARPKRRLSIYTGRNVQFNQKATPETVALYQELSLAANVSIAE